MSYSVTSLASLSQTSVTGEALLSYHNFSYGLSDASVAPSFATATAAQLQRWLAPKRIMTTIKIIFSLVVILAALSCKGSNASSDNPKLAYAFPPESFPPTCKLMWKSKPLMLTTVSQEDRDFTRMIVGFWTEGIEPINLDDVKSGVSNVYATSSNNNALVLLALEFKTDDRAKEAYNQLAKKYSEKPQFWIHESKSHLFVSSKSAELPQECADHLQSEIKKLIK